VESGLAAGDKVVTDGADRLRDGLHVRVSSVDGKQVAPAAVPAGDGGQKGKGGGRSRRQGGGTGQ
jgi:multidrug efflux system membrane fusion protein